MNKIIKYCFSVALIALAIYSCDKPDRPELGDYPKDSNPPGGPLKFYTAFDGQSDDKLRNAVDSIRATFAAENTGTIIDGASGKAVQLVAGKQVKYPAANDWASSTSFSVSFWEKHDGVPPNEAQFAFSIPSNVGHWSGGTMFLLFDHTGAGATNNLAVIKFFVLDGGGEHWFELTNENRMPDIYDNKWHHLVFSYDQGTSNMKIYRDGVLFRTLSWTGHGPITMNTSKISSFLVGGKCVSGWGESWIGGMDQFRLYNKALTDAEVQSLYANKQ